MDNPVRDLRDQTERDARLHLGPKRWARVRNRAERLHRWIVERDRQSASVDPHAPDRVHQWSLTFPAATATSINVRTSAERRGSNSGPSGMGSPPTSATQRGERIAERLPSSSSPLRPARERTAIETGAADADAVRIARRHRRRQRHVGGQGSLISSEGYRRRDSPADAAHRGLSGGDQCFVVTAEVLSSDGSQGPDRLRSVATYASCWIESERPATVGSRSSGTVPAIVPVNTKNQSPEPTAAESLNRRSCKLEEN